MANIERIKDLITLLKLDKSTERFNMVQYLYTNDEGNAPLCESAACIAGHCMLLAYPNAKVLYSDEIIYDNKVYDVHGEARNYLGLTTSQADWLFYGDFRSAPLSQITIDQAIKALEVLIAHPDIDPLFLNLFDEDGNEIENAVEDYLNS